MVNYKSHSDPATRLKKIRENGQRNSKFPKALIVDRISPEIRLCFGDDFHLMTEGAGLYGYKFGYVFTTCMPTTPKMNFWWREVAARSDSGSINFL